MTEFWDRIGISASILCAIHCVLTPLLVILIPFAGNFLAGAWIHVAIAVVIFPVAIWALWNGYRRHRHPRILIAGGIGLLFMAAGMFFEGATHSSRESALQTLFMIAAGLTLASAHYFNLRACRITHRNNPPQARP
jgi:CDP-diglyceride synthetase